MIRTLIALRLKELLHAMGKRTKAGGKGKGKIGRASCRERV